MLPRIFVNNKRRQIAAAISSAAVPATVLVLAAFALFGQQASAFRIAEQLPKQQTLSAFCARWSESQKQLCEAYVEARGEDKFTAAVTWRLGDRTSYECSGVFADCLHDDWASGSSGTSCQPVADGEECEFGICKEGFCINPKQQLQQQERDTEQVDVESQEDVTDGEPIGSPEHRILAEKAEQAGQGKTASTAAQAKESARAKAAPQSLYASMSRQAILDMLKKGPNPNWQTAEATVKTDQTWTRVPEGYLATSHAWQRIHDYADERTIKAWASIFNAISPTPVLRIGGADQDRMSQLPSQMTWDALKKLQKQTNARFVIGLPLWPKNSVDMSKKIMAAATRNLGDAVIVFELGNEPEFWPQGLGGWGKDGKWKKGFDAYVNWFDRVARAINPCNNNPMLSGPGWGNLNTQPTKWTATVLYKGKDCYLKELNLHYYPYINNETVTARELLSQPLQDFGVQKYKEFHKLITPYPRMGIRISETNSLYGGGRPDLSDTLVGALWVADALFAFGLAGAKAFHLHWGIGGDPSGSLGQPNTGVQTNFHFDVAPGEPPVPWPSVHAPWYGYLLWTIAASGNYGKHPDTNFVPANVDKKGKCGANAKVWALKTDNGRLRIVLINKDEYINCNMRINIPSNYCAKPASLTRMLPNGFGMRSKGSIYFQGQTYENAGYTGRLQGQYESFALAPQKFKDGKCGFRVPMPAASAALIFAR